MSWSSDHSYLGTLSLHLFIEKPLYCFTAYTGCILCSISSVVILNLISELSSHVDVDPPTVVQCDGPDTDADGFIYSESDYVNVQWKVRTAKRI